jgi:hypothetical protein
MSVDMVLHCPVTFTWAIAPGAAVATVKASIERNNIAPEERPRLETSCFKGDLVLKRQNAALRTSAKSGEVWMC